MGLHTRLSKAMTQCSDTNASFIAPLVVPVVMFIVLLFKNTHVASAGFTSLCTAVISYFGFVIFLLPLHKILKAKRKEGFLPLLLSGLIGGAVLMAGLYHMLGLFLGSRDNIQVHIPIIGAIFGGLVAIVFCVLSRSICLKPTAKKD